jgi:hypothetical protein
MGFAIAGKVRLQFSGDHEVCKGSARMIIWHIEFKEMYRKGRIWQGVDRRKQYIRIESEVVLNQYGLVTRSNEYRRHSKIRAEDCAVSSGDRSWIFADLCSLVCYTHHIARQRDGYIH